MTIDTIADADLPASSDERVEAFADFLAAQEEEKELSEGLTPEDEAAADPSGADTQSERHEPEDPAIGPPVSWDNDAKELFAI